MRFKHKSRCQGGECPEQPRLLYLSPAEARAGDVCDTAGEIPRKQQGLATQPVPEEEVTCLHSQDALRNLQGVLHSTVQDLNMHLNSSARAK